MHTECRNITFYVKMSLWSQTSQLSGTHNHTRRSCPASRQTERFPLKISLTKIKKGVTEVYRIFTLLPKLHTTPFGTALSVFQTPQRNVQSLCTNKFGRKLHKPQQGPRKFLSVSVKTTTKKETTYSHVRCKLRSSSICYHDQR